jgi:drug/metabolite transporter (DMT)-like permease
MTCIGIWYWEPMSASDWMFMLTLCCTSCLGHYLLIRAYEMSEASAIQPFAYLQLVFGTALGVFAFGDVLKSNVVLGTAIVVGAGIFALMRGRRVAQDTAAR